MVMNRNLKKLIKDGYLEEWLRHPVTNAFLEELKSNNRYEDLVPVVDVVLLRMLQGRMQVIEQINTIITTKPGDLPKTD